MATRAGLEQIDKTLLVQADARLLRLSGAAPRAAAPDSRAGGVLDRSFWNNAYIERIRPLILPFAPKVGDDCTPSSGAP